MKKLVSVLLAFSVVLSCFVFAGSASAKSDSQIRSEISDLEAKSKDLEEKIADIKSEKDKQEEVRDLLIEQINNLQEQINVCTDEINELQAKIDELEEEIAKKEQEIEATKTLLKQRIRAIYMSGSFNSDMLILTGDHSFSDYLTGHALAKSISAKDKSIVDEVNAAIVSIQESQKDIEAQVEEQNEAKKVLDEKKAALKEKEDEVNGVIYSLSKDQKSLQSENAEMEAEIQRLTDEINAGMQTEENQNVVYGGGDFGWPVPGYYNITSYYGQRWGKLHAGIDISSSGISGKPIVAAMDGNVMVSGWSTGGYGYYVTINHGYKDGDYYTTLYAHMTRTACSAGQKVKKGDVIGYVGSTGNSTGPHCHFEIRINGSPVNPMNFL
jgi:hypothetical protein